MSVGAEEQVFVAKEYLTDLLEKCKEQYGSGFHKQYREMTDGAFCEAVMDYLQELGLIEDRGETIKVSTAVGKIIGRYPEDFGKNGGENE